jgi:hypothetical protein
MKRLLFLALALLLTPALAGCDSGSDDDNGGNSGGDNSGGISATVDGAAFSPDSVNPTFDGGVLQVTGIRGTADQLTIAVPNASQGTFNISQTSQVMIMYREGTTAYQANGVTALGGASGTVTISSLSESGASGTFSGTLLDAATGGGTITVTDGSFDVTF